MPTTQEKMDRKKLLEKYRSGTLSEKTKKAFGFPLGPVQLDFDPHQPQKTDQDDPHEGE